MAATPRAPPLAHLRDVRVVDARHVNSHQAFRGLISEFPDEPVVLRHAPLHCTRPFTVEALTDQLAGLRMPERSTRNFFVGDQRSMDVMDTDQDGWDPLGCTFSELMRSICTSSGLYLTTRSANRACQRAGKSFEYDATKCSDGSDVVVRELVPRAPLPLLLPEQQDMVAVFWFGAPGRCFGLHTDLFCEQYVLQNQGIKEVFLLLPEDAGLLKPYSFLAFAKFYKSLLRTVANIDLIAAGALHTELRPGDVLFIPPFWWHELRTVTPGPSLTTTFRVHLPENKQFYTAVENLHKLYRSMVDRGAERLARHICSFFVDGLAHAERLLGEHRGPDSEEPNQGARQNSVPIWAAALLAASCAAAGFFLGHKVGSGLVRQLPG